MHIQSKCDFMPIAFIWLFRKNKLNLESSTLTLAYWLFLILARK